MTLKSTLSALVQVIADEAERNLDFRARIESVLHIGLRTGAESTKFAEPKRKGGRRTPALIDPVDLARHGERNLTDALARLDLEQLRDVVAQYGMDPGKLVMKWKNLDRIRDRIVELSLARATKGDAFRAS